MEITARDGYRLGATLFQPTASNGRAVMVMAATGVPQEYYGKFAAFLAERGFTVLTFDYRGIGRSLHGPVRAVKAGMRDWALLDAAAAFEFLEKNFPNERLMAIGHSFGGQALRPAAAARAHRRRVHRRLAERLLAQLAGAVRPGLDVRRDAHRHAADAAPVRLFPRLARRPGRGPAGRRDDRMGELVPPPEIPRGRARRRARVRALQGAAPPVRDHRRPLRAAARGRGAWRVLYPNRQERRSREVKPEDVNAERIGHFGFFRERFRDSLWREACDWLEAQ